MMNWKGGLGEILGQAQKMKDEVRRIQESAAGKTAEGSAGGGMVRVTANGKLQILSVELDPEVLKKGDREMLQDLVKAGVNDALKNAQALMADEMSHLTASLGPLASFMKGTGDPGLK